MNQWFIAPGWSIPAGGLKKKHRVIHIKKRKLPRDVFEAANRGIKLEKMLRAITKFLRGKQTQRQRQPRMSRSANRNYETASKLQKDQLEEFANESSKIAISQGVPEAEVSKLRDRAQNTKTFLIDLTNAVRKHIQDSNAAALKFAEDAKAEALVQLTKAQKEAEDATEEAADADERARTEKLKLEGTLKRLAKEERKASDKISRLETDLTNADRRSATLEDDLRRAEARIATTDTITKNEQRKAEAAIAKAKEEIAKTKARKDEVEKELRDAKDRVDKIAKERDSEKTKVEDLIKEREEAKKRKEEVEKELQDAKDAAEELERQNKLRADERSKAISEGKKQAAIEAEKYEREEKPKLTKELSDVKDEIDVLKKKQGKNAAERTALLRLEEKEREIQAALALTRPKTTKKKKKATASIPEPEIPSIDVAAAAQAPEDAKDAAGIPEPKPAEKDAKDAAGIPEPKPAEKTKAEEPKPADDPAGLGREIEDLTSADQINKFCSRIPGFIGAFTEDELMDYKDDFLQEGSNSAIVLTDIDKKTNVGHWNLLIVENDIDNNRFTIYWYDPQGQEPNKDILKKLKDIVADEPIKYEVKINRMPNQDIKSNLCGFHCMSMLSKLHQGIPWKVATGYQTDDTVRPTKEYFAM